MSWNIENLKWKWFDKNPQNINRNWRPRKQFSMIISEVENLWYQRPSYSEVVELCWLLLSLSQSDLKRIEKSDEYPMIMKILASRLLSDRWFETVEKILDRVYGKTLPQKNTHDTDISSILKEIQVVNWKV